MIRPPTKTTRHARTFGSQLISGIIVVAMVQALAAIGCTRPGLSLSADPTQGPIYQGPGPIITPPGASTADTTLPLAGALGTMVMSIGGLIVVVLGFRLVGRMADQNSKHRPTQPQV